MNEIRVRGYDEYGAVITETLGSNPSDRSTLIPAPEPKPSIIPVEGGRYHIAIMWGDDAKATFRDGVFFIDERAWIAPSLVTVLERIDT